MENVISIVIGLLSAGIVQLLKLIKLPSKWAPTVCLIVAVILVSVAKALGLELDVQTVAEALMKALGIAGVTVLAYDQLKKLTETR